MYFYFALVIFILTATVRGADWHYGNVSEWRGLCENGTQQSPIDLVDRTAEQIIYSAFNFTNYEIYNRAVVGNNGHTVTITLNTTNTPILSGGGLVGNYMLDHLHFHWQSEHTINGQRFPLEMHLVHYNSKYTSVAEASQYFHGLAVLGVLFELSIDDDEDFIPLIEVMQKVDQYPHTEVELVRQVAAKNFLPRNTANYYRYMGSLTTPECNEGVIWTVFEKMLPISADQVEHFEAVWSGDGPLTLNFRPIQPINNRTLTLRSSPKKNGNAATTLSISTTLMLTFLLVPFVKKKLL